MNSFKAKNIKSPILKQGNETIAARFNVSTKNNKVAVITVPCRITYDIDIRREKIFIGGFTNGKPNGSLMQTIGNGGIVAQCEIDFSYNNYIPNRNAILAVLTDYKAFSLQGITTQQYQTIPTLNKGIKNYIRGYATDISFDDTFNGIRVADGSDKIKFTFHEITETQNPKNKKSIYAALDKATNTLDKVQTNIGYATVALSTANTTFIETAKSISNFGSGVSDFISEINQLQSSIGTLVNSPTELKNSFASAIKSFQGIFSSGSATTQTQYYATLKTLCEYNKDVPLNLAISQQKDKSELPIYSNIEKNIILGKTTIFVRATGLLILCNIYQNYDFANTTEALEVWQNIIDLYNLFASETKFDGLAPASNISSNFTNSIYNPEAFNAVRDFVYQTLEIIRNIIFTEKEITFETISETSNLYEIIVKRYGRFDEDKLNNFMLLNNISSYLTLIKAGTQVRFN
jgi:hypothetical protein